MIVGKVILMIKHLIDIDVECDMTGCIPVVKIWVIDVDEFGYYTYIQPVLYPRLDKDSVSVAGKYKETSAGVLRQPGFFFYSNDKVGEV